MQQWNLLEQVFTVETIMTPRHELLKWSGDYSLDSLWEKADERKVDTIPILENDEIKRVLRRNNNEPADVRFILYNASIPSAVMALADETELSRLFVTFHGTVVGLVTPADLNKLASRTYFYNLLSSLEMEIAERIRQHFDDIEKPILDILKESCTKKRYKELQKAIDQGEQDDLKIDIVNWLYLPELVKIVKQSDELRGALGFSSRTQIDKQLNGLVDLRNDVMHSVKSLLTSKRTIGKLHEQLQRMQGLLQRWNEISSTIV